jgi:hypothetical protein
MPINEEGFVSRVSLRHSVSADSYNPAGTPVWRRQHGPYRGGISGQFR